MAEQVTPRVYTCTYSSLPERLNIGGWGAKDAVFLNPWHAIQQLMAGTNDHIVWIVTLDQLAGFQSRLKDYKLDQYLVVAHRDREKSGTTNRRYDVPRKLKVFIMKGAKK